MRHDHLKRELDILLMLSQNRSYTVEEICEKADISRRNFYYFIDFFRLAGFKVEKHGRFYSIDRSSKFFTKLFDIIQFSEDEALLMRQLIENADMSSSRLKSLHQKLDRFYDFKILEDEVLQRKTTTIRASIYQAIKMQRMIRIVGYSSPSSHSVTDRLVEPFLFMNNNRDVRCYEIASGKNKTFRLSRMDDVEVLDDEWQHRERHRQAYTDLFAFSGEETMRVTLIMGQLSHNVMLEEYPESAASFVQQADKRWLFKADVCSYLGVGRFVLGLYDDIEIIGDDGFREYIAGKISRWHATLKK
ncbi:MAG: WYL domain-containing protein [Prevotella sp.]|nr:WYL domain-containing protein [Candidatus Prevotella equi]